MQMERRLDKLRPTAWGVRMPRWSEPWFVSKGTSPPPRTGASGPNMGQRQRDPLLGSGVFARLHSVQ